MSFCGEVTDLKKEEALAAKPPGPPKGARILGMVNPPTIEELWWHHCELQGQIWDLQAKTRNTRIFILVVLVIYFIRRWW